MSKKLLIVLTIILIIVNTYAIAFFPANEQRITRSCSVLSYLILFVTYNGFKISKNAFIVLFLFFITDVLALDYENPIFSKIIFILRIVIYYFLMLDVYKKVKIERVKPLVYIIFSVIIGLNLYLLYVLAESAFKNLNDIFEYCIILVYGATLVASGALAVNYNLRYNSKRSTYFFYTILAFILSDLSWFLAYYLNYSLLYYSDVLFYLLCLYALVNYALHTRESEDVLITYV